MNYLKTALSTLTITAFVASAIYYVTNHNQQIQLRNIEVKSKETKLIELNAKYDEILQYKVESEQQKQEQQKKIEELEKERQRLQGELQAKLNRQQQEREKLATAALRATGTASASAAGNCADWIAQAGIADTGNAIELIRRESGCNPNAVNRSSGACGIAQELPCGKSGCSLGDGACQVRWMNKYVQNRYGSWAAAVAFHNRNNWY